MLVEVNLYPILNQNQILSLCRLSVVLFVVVVLVFVMVCTIFVKYGGWYVLHLSLDRLSVVLFVIVVLGFVRYGCQYFLLYLFLFVFVVEGLVYLSVVVFVCVVSFLQCFGHFFYFFQLEFLVVGLEVNLVVFRLGFLGFPEVDFFL